MVAVMRAEDHPARVGQGQGEISSLPGGVF